MSNKTPLQAIIVVSSLGMQFAISLAAGYYGGSYLDEHFQSGQVFMIIGLLLGIGAGIFAAIKLVKPFLND
ncbi:hypothetical protein BHU72_04935 [Desulfuribacillus stibiiarsenatis]|uniref:Uncharacterized protein n=1 Tax=Desulfuribacillus stibiiarsenatis TaxID=1390249 RepID=A0A1E5L5M6_9FIRM|nr:AtpZ/AtpI family protein [Desulfuribacillus stibiiarsenatis]OEH85435.1 hypothetical protein BHU72_04935 [Desulfuribacillus stibiiarsenatis]